AKLMNLVVRFAADIECVVHRLTAGGGADAIGAEGCALAGRSSLLVSRGRSDGRTSTSSRRSRFADGLTRICLNGLPALISVTVPTGRSRGKMRSMPLVMTRSPRLTSSSFGSYFITKRGLPCHILVIWIWEYSSIALMLLYLS